MPEGQDWHRLYRALKDIPANGQPPADPDQHRLWIDLIAFGLIEQQTITKPCKTCGTARPDYSFYRAPAAGRALVWIVDETAGPEKAGSD